MPIHLEDSPFQRLWKGFLTGRIMVALVLLMLQLANFVQSQQTPRHWHWMLALSGGYLLATVALRVCMHHTPPKPQPGMHWLPSIGVDIALMCGVQWLKQSGSFDVSPLFGLPLLMASVLGTLTLALGVTAIVTLLLLTGSLWLGLQNDNLHAWRYQQTALVCTGYFVIAILANQLSNRLRSAQQTAYRIRMDVRTHKAVNALVIQHVKDGVLVVDHAGMVRLANPAALLMLGSQIRGNQDNGTPLSVPFALAHVPAWIPLADLARQTLDCEEPQMVDMDIIHEDQNSLGLRVRAWRTCEPQQHEEALCVLFLHDLRELREQLRTERLAVMGRMSAAVAHEFRNPLAAIAQAGQLLDEYLGDDPRYKRLTGMVQQNVERLVRITEDVLDATKVPDQTHSSPIVPLDATVRQFFQEWQALEPGRRRARLLLGAAATQVHFDPEDLRRVMVNLLDNALRYRGEAADSLCIITRAGGSKAGLQVWSDGAPLSNEVERHLFEPFSSSQSRSTGLGLYICRELCQRHAATIDYRRTVRHLARGSVPGNAFIVTLRSAGAPPPDTGYSASQFDTLVP